MNHAYRLVWSALHRACVVAPETARGGGRAVLCACCLAGASLAQAQAPAATVVPAAAAGSATKAYVSANGVPVVNINTANGAGVSYNQYQRYDVDSRGLVLNNSLAARQSALAGQVDANPGLRAEARLILNEVVAPQRSMLAGFTEVLGGRADLVLANPYGITCSGCGFINIDRVTLSTGTPVFGANGSLSGLQVRTGDVLVQGLGLNASDQQLLDIVTRSVKLEGPVNARDLQVAAGPSQWNYAGRAVSGAAAGTGAAPAYAVDSSRLGGIYADRIRLIATEAGVGVRMLGDAAARTDDVVLDSAGRIQLYGRLSAARNVSLIQAGDAAGITMADPATPDAGLAPARASVSAGAALSVSTAGDLALSGGELKAGTDLVLRARSLDDRSDSAAIRAANGRLDAVFSGAASIQGARWGAGSRLALSAASLAVDGGTLFYSGADALAAAEQRDLRLATSADMALNAASLVSGADLRLAAGGNLALGAGADIEAGRDMALTARGALRNAAELLAGQTLGLHAATPDAVLAVENSGRMQGRTLVIGAPGEQLTLQNGGSLLGASVDMAGAGLDNAGRIQASERLAAQFSGNLLNRAGAILANTAAGNQITLSAATLDNQGVLQSAGTLDVRASGALTNRGTMLTLRAIDGGADGAMLLAAGSLDNSGWIAAAGANRVLMDGGIDNRGRIQGDTLFLGAGSLFNRDAGSILRGANGVLVQGKAGFLFDNAGLLWSGGSLTLQAPADAALHNQDGGMIASDGQMTLYGGQLGNNGLMQAGAGMTLGFAAKADNQGRGVIQAGTGLLKLSAAALDNSGQLQAGAGMEAVVSGQLRNSGLMLNQDSARALTLGASRLDNAGTLQSLGAARLDADILLTNRGLIQSAADMDLFSRGDLVNDRNGRIAGEADIRIAGPDAQLGVTNLGSMHADGLLQLGAAGATLNTLRNTPGATLQAGRLSIDAGDLINSARIQSEGAADIRAASLANDNSAAVILTGLDGSASSLFVDDVLRNQGAIHGGGRMALQAGSITNGETGGISSRGNLSLHANAYGMDNSGALYAGGVLTLSAPDQAVVNRSSGTMDGRDIVVRAGAFDNYNAVSATRDIDIAVTDAFRNLPTGGVPEVLDKVVGASTSIVSRSVEQIDIGARYITTVYEEQEGVRQELSSALPALRGRIIAGRTLMIDYGGKGENLASLLSAPTVSIGSSRADSAGFINADLHLDAFTRTRRWKKVELERTLFPTQVTYWYPESEAKFSCDPRLCFTASAASADAARAASYVAEIGRTTIKAYDAGIYAGKLLVKGADLSNLGSPYPATVQEVSASRQTVPDEAWIPGEPAVTIVTGGNPDLRVRALPFDVANLRLPTNPNGYFVLARDPQASYLVETNPLFVSPPAVPANPRPGDGAVALPAAAGSDYLAGLLHLDPDKVQKRLGDAAYETLLVRQQLIEQVGRNLLQAGASEATQMKTLMENSVDQLETLGLVFGRALSDEQAAAVESDMVWMVEVEIKGRKVLIPVVYLSQATRKGYASGPTIAAGSIDADVASLTNRGGEIRAEGKLAVKSAGDVRNESGRILAGDAVIVAGGDFSNEKVAITTGGGKLFSHTDMGKTASVESAADLSIAASNIAFKGAAAQAGQDLSLEARQAIKLETQDDDQARSGVGGVKRHASVLKAGGNLDAAAGSDILVAGSRLASGKDMVLDAGGNLDILARTDTQFSGTQSSKSGVGVDGGVYGVVTTTEERTDRQNRKAEVSAGGRAALLAGSELVVSGSDIAAGDKLLLAGDQVSVRANRVESSTEKVTETTSFLATSKSSKAEAKAGASAQASASDKVQKQAFKTVDGVSVVDDSKGNTTSDRAIAMADATVGASRAVGKDGKAVDTSQRVAKAASQSLTGTQTLEKPVTADGKPAAQVNTRAALAKAEAKAEAGATGTGELKLMRNEVLTERSGERTLARSSLSGKEVDISATADLEIESAAVRAERDLRISGKSVRITAAANTTASSTASKTTEAGLMGESKNTASAKASASASADAKSARVESEKGGGVGIDAKAALDAKAEAKVEAKSDNIVDLVRVEEEKKRTIASESQESSITAGGKLSITALDTLRTEGGTLSGREGVDLKARDMLFDAAADTTASGSGESKTGFGLALKGEASAGASAAANVQGEASTSFAKKSGNDTGAYGRTDRDAARASVSASATASASANADASAQGGLQFRHSAAGKEATSEKARVTRIVSAQGDVSRVASGKITDVGTAIEAGGNVLQQSGTFESRAASDTGSRRDDSSKHAGRVVAYAKAGAGATAEANASATAGLGYLGGNALDKNHESDSETRAGASVGAQLEYSYDGAKKSDSSATAVVSGIKAGGDIAIATAGAMRIEGSQLQSGGRMELSGQRIDILAASNSSASASTRTSASGTLSAGTGVGSNSAVEGSLKGELKNDAGDSSRSSARVAGFNAGGDLAIRSQGDLLLEGTRLTAGGNAEVSAAGNLDYRAARDKSQSDTSKVSGDLALSAGKTNENNKARLAINAGYERAISADEKAIVGAVRAGGDLALKGGQAVTVEGAAFDAKGNTVIEAGGALTLNAARDATSSSTQEFKGGVNAARTRSADNNGNAVGEKTGAVDASGAVETQRGNQATAVAIASGGTVSTRSQADTLFEGAAITAGGDIRVAAGGNLTLDAARSTDEALKVSASLTGKKAESPDSSQNIDQRRAAAGLRSEKNETYQGSVLKSDGAVTVEAGGKAVLVNTEIKSQGQLIRARKVEQRKKQNKQNVVNTGIAGVKRSGGAKPDATAADSKKKALTEQSPAAARGTEPDKPIAVSPKNSPVAPLAKPAR